MNPRDLLPPDLARELGVLVVGEAGGAVNVLTAPHATAATLAAARARIGRPLSAQPVADDRFSVLLTQAYAGAAPAADHGHERAASDAPSATPDEIDLLSARDEGGAIERLAVLIRDALALGASDVHLDATEQGGRIRRRIDGVLSDVMTVDASTYQSLIARAKVMARLDLAERRLPQDGRLRVLVGGRRVDVRVATLPTQHGERAVLRLLDSAAVKLDLGELGMAERTAEALRSAVAAPHGMILVTGPTGSGKTTTLYALVAGLDRERLNVVSVEDPVEYAMDRVAQTQVNPRIDLDFARALRSILRHDPDVIIVGEIRDRETAEIAVQASLTGHLVLASLHTNSAGAAVTRLTDMGVEPYLLASCLRGVLAQRLVRRLAPETRAWRPMTEAERALLAARGVAPEALPEHLADAVEAPGRERAWRGRCGIYRWLPVTAAVAAAIHERAPDTALEALAASAGQGGWPGLLADGVRHLAAGETTLAELLRVTEQ